jgi:secondary thiamine-phosphate synthase enzyme
MVKYLNVKSRQRNEFIDITPRVEEVLRETGIKSGVCYVYVPHTTAGVTINEGADPSVQHDILNTLSGLIPHEGGYHHAEGNSDAHIKSSLVGASQYLLIDDGKLMLGTWQSVFFCEFDGPRHRRVALKFIAGQ